MNNISSLDLNALAAEVHKANQKWWFHLETNEPLNRNKGEMLMLVITELAEAVEGIRKNLMDDKLPHRRMEEVEMADGFIRLLDFAGGFKIKLYEPYEQPLDFRYLFGDTDNKAEQILSITQLVLNIAHDKSQGFSVSKAILAIRMYCAHHGLDLMGAYTEKMAFNAMRKDHQREARLKVDGKKF